MFVGLLLTGYSGRVEAAECQVPNGKQIHISYVTQNLTINPGHGEVFSQRGKDPRKTVYGSLTGGVNVKVCVKETRNYRIIAYGGFLHDNELEYGYVARIDANDENIVKIPANTLTQVSLNKITFFLPNKPQEIEKVPSKLLEVAKYSTTILGQNSPMNILVEPAIADDQIQPKLQSFYFDKKETQWDVKLELEPPLVPIRQTSFNQKPSLFENTEWWNNGTYAENFARNTKGLFEAEYSPGLGPIFAYNSSVSGYRYDYANSGVVSFSGDPSTPELYAIQQIPEPVSILGSGVAVAFGIAFKRELGKAKKK